MEDKKKPIKNNIKRACLIAIFALITALCVCGTYNVLRWKDTNGEYLSSVDMLRATDKNLVDVVFMGSSHGYHGFNPSDYWEDEGWACFDMTISGQDSASTYYHLKNLLRTQSPKVVCVDLYGITFESHAVEGNVYRNYLSMPTSSLSVKLVKEYIEKDKWQDYILRFPIVHTRYRELEKYDFYKYKPNTYLRGERMEWVVGQAEEPDVCDGELKPSGLSESKEKWLDDMYELSMEEGFELIFVVLPFNVYAESQGKMDTVSQYCEERGIAFYDLNRLRKEAGFDYSCDFIDRGHLNARGAKKVELFLKNELECYHLPDHRGDERYYQWDEDLEYNKRLEYQNHMTTVGDLSGLCSLIKSGENYVTVISLEGDYIDDEKDFYEPLSILEMTYDEYEKGGKWIYEDGLLTRVYDNETGKEPFYKELGNMNTLKICYNGDYTHTENIKINNSSFYYLGTHLTIGIYDKELGKTVIVRGF